MIELSPEQSASLQRVLVHYKDRSVAFNQRGGVMQTLEVYDLAHVCLCDIEPDGYIVWTELREREV